MEIDYTSLSKMVNKIKVIMSGAKDNSSLIDNLYQLLPIKSMSDLAIKGQDIIETYLKENINK